MKTDEKPPVPRLVVGVKEAFRMIDVSPSKGYSMMADGSLPYVIIGGRRKISMATLHVLADQGEAS